MTNVGACLAKDCKSNNGKKCELRFIKIDENFECKSFKSIYED